MGIWGTTSRTTRRAALAVALAAAVLAPAGPFRVAPACAETAEAAAELQRFNGAMRELYGEQRARRLAATRPLILVDGDDLVLLTAAGEKRERYTPPLYHTLKSFSHVVLGTFGAASAPGAERPAALDRLRERATALAGQIDGLDLTPAQKARLRELLGKAVAFATAERDRPATDTAGARAALAAFYEQINPLWMASGEESAVAQIEAMAAITKAWHAQLSPADWQALRVVVPGARMPRERNLQVTFFMRLLGERAEGGRIVYTESVFDPGRALGLFGTVMVERDLSEAVFGTPFRMDIDLLGPAGEAALDRVTLPR